MFNFISIVVIAWLTSCSNNSAKIENHETVDKKIIVAYVTSWSSIMPDPEYMTHINYAFGHVNDTFNGIRIDNEERLKDIVALKSIKPDIKILLSIGGWGSGRFSEMAADDKLRKLFAEDCLRIIKEFELDGIDIDWEYPTNSMANISASPDDTKNFTLLMRDIRKAIGKNKLLTLATAANAKYIDFRAINPYIDFVNIMTYDLASAPKHHSALYKSENTGDLVGDIAVKAHINAGIPPNKLTMGMPFYGRGRENYPNFMDYKDIVIPESYTSEWDDVAKVPYLTNDDGDLICGYENPRSLAIKCKYIKDNSLLGGMYWEYDGDNEIGDLRSTIFNNLIKNSTPYKVLVLTERGGQHGDFTNAGIQWLSKQAHIMNFEFTEINNTEPITDEYLSQYKLIIQLDYIPYTWTETAQKAFIKYIDEGRGGWIGFHHATLLGEFDDYPMWNWFSDFMGGIRFKNYIAPLADGFVMVEDKDHPVMKDVNDGFIVQDDEWYTFDKSPRPNVHVLASVNESTYKPASDIKMGDHPVIWVNPNKKAHNVYFLMGHSKKLFRNGDFIKMFINAINWAVDQ